MKKNKLELQNRKNTYTKVSPEDYAWAKDFKWLQIGKYAGRRVNGKPIYLHREITDRLFNGFLKKNPEIKVMRINEDKLDNRRTNLRVKKNGSASVYFHEATGKFELRIPDRKTSKDLGLFKDLLVAKAIRDAYNRRLFNIYGGIN